MKNQIKNYIAENLGIDDDETFEMLFDTYVETLNEHINMLSNAVSAKNFSAIKSSAHALKGCSANIGAEEIRALCLHIEEEYRVENIEGIANDLQQIIALRDKFFV